MTPPRIEIAASKDFGPHRSRAGCMLAVGLLSWGCIGPRGTTAERSNDALLPPEPSTSWAVQPCSPPDSGPPTLIIRRAHLTDPHFRLVSSEITLDGVLVFSSADPERLLPALEVVHQAAATPGHHELSTLQTLKGLGSGAEGYLNSYSFDVVAKHAFNVEPVGGTCSSIVLYYRSGDSTPLEQRPSIRYVDEKGLTSSASTPAPPTRRATDETQAPRP